MTLSISNRKLNRSERELLEKESRKFPDIALIEEKVWRRWNKIYVAMENNKFVGVCVVIQLRDWKKIGPLLILEKYQNRRYGKLLISHVVNEHQNTNIYIGSSNPKVWQMAQDLKFKKVNNVWRLPTEIIIFLVNNFFQRLSLEFLLDAIQKPIIRRKYYYFLKYSI